LRQNRPDELGANNVGADEINTNDDSLLEVANVRESPTGGVEPVVNSVKLS
jgi:hypothetical protein